MGFISAFDHIGAVLTPLAEVRTAQEMNLRLGLERRESDETEPVHQLSAEYGMSFQ